MSRSKRPRCPRGKGCGICPDWSEARKRREQDIARLDFSDGLTEYLSAPARLTHPWKWEACLSWREPDCDG